MARDDDFARVGDLLRELGRELKMRTSFSGGAPTLTQTQGTLMRFVHANPGCTPTEVAVGTGLQRTNVSSALRELKAMGYAETRPHESDARVLRITATPLADQNLELLRGRWGELLEAAWVDAPDEAGTDDLAVTRRTLERFAAYLHRTARP